MPTRYGIVEIILGGTAESPDERQSAALEPFFARASEVVELTKGRLRFAFLYRLVRIVVNDDAKVGLRFRNVLTGSQPLLLVDSE